MRDEFHEDWQNPHTDPMGHGAYDFPFEEVFAKLDGVEASDRESLAQALKVMLLWATDVRLTKRSASKVIASRTVAMLWVIAPESFEGKSIRTIARSANLNLDQLTRATAAFSRRFGIRSPGQAHAWNYKPTKRTTEPPRGQG